MEARAGARPNEDTAGNNGSRADLKSSKLQAVKVTKGTGGRCELRAGIAEVEQRGDFAELAVLTKKKLELDRELRRLHAGFQERNS